MTTRYRKPPDLRLVDLEGEGVVLHLGTRRYFTVSESGLLILNALESPRTFEELVHALLDVYETSEIKVRGDVREFLERCIDARLLLLDSGQ